MDGGGFLEWAQTIKHPNRNVVNVVVRAAYVVSRKPSPENRDLRTGFNNLLNQIVHKHPHLKGDAEIGLHRLDQAAVSEAAASDHEPRPGGNGVPKTYVAMTDGVKEALRIARSKV